eukprot:1142642-Pelagomonas_calceolata.AAC.14
MFGVISINFDVAGCQAGCHNMEDLLGSKKTLRPGFTKVLLVEAHLREGNLARLGLLARCGHALLFKIL